MKLSPEDARDIVVGLPAGLHFDASKAYLFGEDGLRQPAGNIVKLASPAKATAHV